MIVFDSLNSPKLISRKISDSEIHKNCLTFQTLTRLFQTLARIFVTTQVNYSKTRSIWRRTGKWKMAMKQQIFPWIHFANGTSFEIHWTMGPFGNFFSFGLGSNGLFLGKSLKLREIAAPSAFNDLFTDIGSFNLTFWQILKMTQHFGIVLSSNSYTFLAFPDLLRSPFCCLDCQ